MIPRRGYRTLIAAREIFHVAMAHCFVPCASTADRSASYAARGPGSVSGMGHAYSQPNISRRLCTWIHATYPVVQGLYVAHKATRSLVPWKSCGMLLLRTKALCCTTAMQTSLPCQHFRPAKPWDILRRLKKSPLPHFRPAKLWDVVVVFCFATDLLSTASDVD